MRGIYFIRHGNTTYDTKVDALLNPPLNREGVERVKRTVKFMRESGALYDRIISSPLQRALRVAELLSDGQIKVTTNNACLPWNLGQLMGKEGNLVADKLEYLKEYPDIRAPRGESYRTFYNRWNAFVHQLMDYVETKDEGVVVTTHSRNINALQSIIRGNPVGDVEETTPEASVTLLAQNGVGDWSYSVIWDGA
jgi:broad specificity phosphatase PhoE